MVLSKRLPVGFAVLASGVILAGCAATVQPGGPGGPPGSPKPAPASATLTLGQNLTFTDRDNGRTVTVRPGDRIVVKMGNSDWQFSADTSGPALRSLGQPSAQVLPFGATEGCMPGMACGTTTAKFVAAAPGKAVITATRNSCGEAVQHCPPSLVGYQLTVIVSQ